MAKNHDKRFGDRKDGRLLREIDSLHYVMGYLYPGRCDNEAFINERIDLSEIYAYLEKKNSEGIAYKYNVFQVIVSIIIKVLTLRPKLNRFICNGRFYEHNEVSVSFVVKMLFSDEGAERLAFIHGKPEDTIDSIHESIYEQVSKTKSGGSDGSTQDTLDLVKKLPRFLGRFIIFMIEWLDRHGWAPSSVTAADPAHSSCLISNVGSIKLQGGYHHLTSWGTCSMMCMLGQIKNRPVYEEDGSSEIRPVVDIGITLDERVADGYYYAKSMRLIRKLAKNPELLERPFSEELEY